MLLVRLRKLLRQLSPSLTALLTSRRKHILEMHSLRSSTPSTVCPTMLRTRALIPMVIRSASGSSRTTFSSQLTLSRPQRARPHRSSTLSLLQLLSLLSSTSRATRPSLLTLHRTTSTTSATQLASSLRAPLRVPQLSGLLYTDT